MRVSKAYTVDSEWRNRDEFVNGRNSTVDFLTRKWGKELNYRLKKEYWAHTGNRISEKFKYEFKTGEENWFRAYGNEKAEFGENGLMQKRYASNNDVPIKEGERKLK